MKDLTTTTEERAKARALGPAAHYGLPHSYTRRIVDDVDALLAENAKLRAALFPIATGRFASVREACDLAEHALGADAVVEWNVAENARAARGEP